MITPGAAPLVMQRHADFVCTVLLTDANGPVSLVDKDLAAQIRTTKDAPGSPLKALVDGVGSTAEGIHVFDPATDGRFQILVKLATIDAWPANADPTKDQVFAWDLTIDDGTFTERYLEGTVTVRAGVTR